MNVRRFLLFHSQLCQQVLYNIVGLGRVVAEGETLNSQALGNGSRCQSGISLTEQTPIVSFNCGQLPEHGNLETSYCRSQQTLSINVGLIIVPYSQEEGEKDRESYHHKKQMRKTGSQNRAFEPSFSLMRWIGLCTPLFLSY